MRISEKLDQLHLKARGNRWLYLFAIFNRLVLAAGFIPSGMQKIMGERFTVLSVNHPMGNYLEALFYTGYYYTSIGLFQVTAAILLLIPRTATLGAMLYFPIILNICILTFSVRFDGSLLTSPLMVLANLYLLCWDYHKLKLIFPFNRNRAKEMVPQWKNLINKLPFKFFAGVGITMLLVATMAIFGYDIRPRNTLKECQKDCIDSKNPEACEDFCNCIHLDGKTLNKCLEEYDAAIQ